jgi:hypothetical protein
VKSIHGAPLSSVQIVQTVQYAQAVQIVFALDFHVGNMANAISTTKPVPTTKHTKATKGLDNYDFKLRVLRAFVVETLSNILSTGNPEKLNC